MADTFKNVGNKSNPGDRWFAISVEAFDIVPRAILCTATGTLTVEDAAGTSMTLTDVPAFTILPIRPTEATAVTGTFYGLY